MPFHQTSFTEIINHIPSLTMPMPAVFCANAGSGVPLSNEAGMGGEVGLVDEHEVIQQQSFISCPTLIITTFFP